jgi:hypothetical protein
MRYGLSPGGYNPDTVIPAENFMATIAANVDNEELTDAAFRAFIRDTLPFVKYPRSKHEKNKAAQD